MLSHIRFQVFTKLQSGGKAESLIGWMAALQGGEKSIMKLNLKRTVHILGKEVL